MVDYTNALLRICSDVLDTGMRYESASERDDIGARRELHPIQEALFTKKEVKETRKELDKALVDGNQTAQIAAIKKLVEKLKNESQGEKDKHLRIVWFGVFADTDNYILGNKSGYKPVCTQMAKLIKGEISDNLKAKIVESLRKTVNYMPKQLAEKNETFMKHEKESRAILKDVQDALKIME